MRTAVDSSVLVAALLTWHERHAAARDVVERLLAAPEDIVLAADVLVELANDWGGLDNITCVVVHAEPSQA